MRKRFSSRVAMQLDVKVFPSTNKANKKLNTLIKNRTIYADMARRIG